MGADITFDNGYEDEEFFAFASEHKLKLYVPTNCKAIQHELTSDDIAGIKDIYCGLFTALQNPVEWRCDGYSVWDGSKAYIQL